MITQINNIEDVSAFFQALYNEGVSAHPDDDFRDYINFETKEPTYTLDEAILRNRLMEISFTICDNDNIDIYELMLEAFSNDCMR